MTIKDLLSALVSLQETADCPDATPVELVDEAGRVMSLGFVTLDGNGHIYLDPMDRGLTTKSIT